MHMYDPNGFIHQERQRRAIRRRLIFTVVAIASLSVAVITLSLALSLAQR